MQVQDLQDRLLLLRCPSGHLDIAELRYEGGKGFLFVAVDRTSKLAFARYRRTTKLAAAAFLRVLIKTVPYKIHTILTDNGMQFIQRPAGQHRLARLVPAYLRTHRPRERDRASSDQALPPIDQWPGRTHGAHDQRSHRQIIPLRLDPGAAQELRRHVSDWRIAYTFAKQLKALRFKTPYEAVEELWKSKPEIFIVKPNHQMPGLNT